MSSFALNKFCVINNPEQAQEVSGYLAKLFIGDGNIPNSVIGNEARRIHKNRYNHLLEKIRHAEASLEKEKTALARTSSFVCYEKTITEKTFVGNKKIMVTSTKFVWEDVVDLNELATLHSVKSQYEQFPSFI